MKINKEELRRMINQIDDDLLYEAAEEYHTSYLGSWKRVIPVAACIALLILSAAVAVLRNITIDKGHEGIEGTAISEHKGNTQKEDILNDSEKSYTISIGSKENTINSVLDLITASFGEKGVSKELAVQSIEIRLLPKDNTVLNGRVALTDMENFTDITVSISQNKIIIDMENSTTKNDDRETDDEETINRETVNKETGYTETSYKEADSALQEETGIVQNVSSEESISRINWYDFYKAAQYIPEITTEFQDSQYMMIHAELVAILPDATAIPDNISILIYDGELQTVENREELLDLLYSYAFFVRTSVTPDVISRDFLVYVK